MKKTKLVWFLFIFLFTTGFVSCGNNDEEEYVNLNNTKDLIGVWNINRASFDIAGKDKAIVNAIKNQLKPIWLWPKNMFRL